MRATPAQRRDELRDRFPRWRPRALHDLVDEAAAEFPDRPVMLADDRTITYREAVRWSRRLADGLASLGTGPGDRVGIVLANYPEFLPVKLAISRLGAVAVPFNYLYRADELSYVLRQSRCRTLISMTGFDGLDYLEMLDRVAPGWESGSSTAQPSLRSVILFATDGRERPGVPTLASLTDLGGSPPDTAGHRVVDPAGISDIFYTSGTTGRPKGAALTHDALLRSAFGSALTRAFEPNRRVLVSLPLYHLFGYVEGLLACLWVGGAAIPRVSFSPADYLQAVEQHQANEILTVPTMTIALLQSPELDAHDLSSLHAVMSAAAAAPTWVWQRLRERLGDCEITTGYGMTETSAGITMTRPEDPLIVHTETVGAVKMAGPAGLDATGDLARLKTIDPGTGEDLPPGAEGEIAIRTPCGLSEYWDEPGETQAVLRDGWVHTGDIGRVRDDGFLLLTGRSKELYKSGGELVMPREIEELLVRAVPGISQVHVVGLPDERWGEVGCAVVVAEPDATITEARILDACRVGLARFKVPKHAVLLDAESLPTTATGKVQKIRLAQLMRSHLDRGTAEPATEKGNR